VISDIKNAANWRASLQALYPIGLFLLIVLSTLTLFRLGLISWQWDRVSAVDKTIQILLYGARFDLVLLGMLLIIPATITPLASLNAVSRRYWNQLLRVYLLICTLAIVFLELSTPSFITQYDARPNYLFVEYLIYPREVFSTLWGEYPLQLIFSFVVMVSLTVFGWKRSASLFQGKSSLKIIPTVLVTPLVFMLCFFAARSSLDHRPINPSQTALSEDPMVNDIALNSTYSLMYAIYESKRDETGGVRYGQLADSEIMQTIHHEIGLDNTEFKDPLLPTLHKQKVPLVDHKPYNLVIILEESLGAEFVGSMGGADLTPNIDKLSREGLWFKNLYATGTRSVRGIEAVVTGFPPTPARSVVKLNKTQRDFFTVAQLLENKGYDTSFIYGGESHFDNMRRFFANNGFHRIIDKHDYPHPQFIGSWGVSDEDLFEKANSVFSAYGDKPFFSLIFTSSNHSPFEFPDDRIKASGPKKNTVENAVRYADYALGKFIDTARSSSYWDNTIFLIVADHNSRVYGPEIIPINRFHIPGLVLGKSIRPETLETIASQIDLAPTMLSLIGIESEHPMIGHDLTLAKFKNEPGRAILQYNSTFGLLQGNHIVVLQKDLPPAQYLVANDHIDHQEPGQNELIHIALSYSIWASDSINNHTYTLPIY
jgi:phosphoglycerol transferase MdoB-like AlkP superfamily enzyme